MMLSFHSPMAATPVPDMASAITGLDGLAAKLDIFFLYSECLPLSPAEQQTLLDIGPAELLRLRSAPELRGGKAVGKLERRVDYALPLLRRMVAAVAN